jgi:hypothetical protein
MRDIGEEKVTPNYLYLNTFAPKNSSNSAYFDLNPVFSLARGNRRSVEM